MLQSLTWFATDKLARSQFQVFSDIGAQMRLSDDDQRRVLLMSEQEWAEWSDFRRDGPLPAQPAQHHRKLRLSRQRPVLGEVGPFRPFLIR